MYFHVNIDIVGRKAASAITQLGRTKHSVDIGRYCLISHLTKTVKIYKLLNARRTPHTKLQKMQLSTIRTTTFFHNCNGFFISFFYVQRFSHRLFLEKS